MSQSLSRRDFLKRSGGALAAMALPPVTRRMPDVPLPAGAAAHRAAASLGRVTADRLSVHVAPDATSKVNSYRVYDDLINLFGTDEGPGPMVHNSVWFKTRDGYVYSSFVQPVGSQLNRPLLPSQVTDENPVLLDLDFISF